VYSVVDCIRQKQQQKKKREAKKKERKIHKRSKIQVVNVLCFDEI